jgi:predicted NUDIX family NTP pyrophosphohydrolase
MGKVSAGLLLFRLGPSGLEVLLVHPGGPFFRGRDAGAWSIPKGEVGPGEDPLAAARREFAEEIGVAPAGPFLPLSPVVQKGGKRVHAWAVEGDLDPGTIRSNTVGMEWPPRSGRLIEFPEVDRAAFFPTGEATRRINPAQAALIVELASLIEARGRS